MEYKNPQAHEWYLKNKEAKKEYNQKYGQINKDVISMNKKEYWNNPLVRTRKSRYDVEYRKKNHNKIRTQRRPYEKAYYRKNKLKENLKHLRVLTKQATPLNLINTEYKRLLQIWSELIRNRDHYSCVQCGKSSTHEHHIIFRNIAPKLSLNLSNGIALCSPCHKEIHKLNGY